MKYNSLVRQCLFNKPQWSWYPVDKLMDYPDIVNTLHVKHKRLGEYKQYLSIPCEIYIVMDQQNIDKILGFRLDNKLFSADVIYNNGKQENLKLWVYANNPKYINK